MNHPVIAFIGAGNMARSLINGLLSSGTPAASLRASDPSAEQRGRLGALGIDTLEDNAEAVRGADVVVLAVKPQILGQVLPSVPLKREQLVISIAAGVPLGALEAWAAAEAPIVRGMPNTPALLGAGITGMHANARASAADRQTADQVMRAAGATLWVEREDLLDAVTAVSGSGPAYFFYLMEAMIEAGTALGLDRDSATTLTLETALGAARMAREGNDPPATLRANVTSPGGTTERALSILDAAGTRGAVEQAMAGAAQRARELAKEFGQS
ncbi:MAG: pyrroline-5-carboxylate reductase [Pseudomonadota bacterium]